MAGKNIALNAKVNKDLPYLSHIISDLGDLIGYDYNGVTTILPASGVDNGITANVGSTQATGTELNYRNSRITVCANIGDAVTLMFARKGMSLVLVNSGATSMDVFPATGDAINALAANAAFAVAAAATAQLNCFVDGQWHSIT